jgi:hypothetical protein
MTGAFRGWGERRNRALNGDRRTWRFGGGSLEMAGDEPTGDHHEITKVRPDEAARLEA